MNVVRRYSAKKQREIARRQAGRAYRKRKGITTCWCNGWWFPHRKGPNRRSKECMNTSIHSSKQRGLLDDRCDACGGRGIVPLRNPVRTSRSNRDRQAVTACHVCGGSGHDYAKRQEQKTKV